MKTLLVSIFIFLNVQLAYGTADGAKVEKRQLGQDKVLRVTTILNPPFMMQKPKSNRDSGNDRFEGFLPEMFAELARRVNITYSISVVKDGKYGSKLEDGNSWNGMMGEVLDGTAHFAVADLTITAARKAALHFTHPYMTSGIGILIRKTDDPPPNYFFFLIPFAGDQWIATIAVLVGLSVIMCLFARFSHAEWTTENELSGNGSASRKNQLSFGNSFYFMVASLSHQNSNVAPRALSTRFLSMSWWIFCFFFTAIYIANLSAILVHQLDEMSAGSSMENVEDLAKQTKVKYGTLRGGSTWGFFKTSSIGTYQRMYAYMESSKPSVYVQSYSDGLQKVMHENYAMFMESTSIDYATERYCNLTQLGSLLDYKGFGIAMSKDNPYLHPLSQAILQMQEEGRMLALKKKWWGEDGGGGLCNKETDDESSGSPSVGKKRFGGVFVILGIGVAISLVVGILELILAARTAAKEQGGSLSDELIRDARFAICGATEVSPKRNSKRNDDGAIILQQHDR